MKAKNQGVMYAVMISLAAAIVFGLGLLAGGLRYSIKLDSLRQAADMWDQAAFLGRMVPEEQRKGLSRVYHDPEAALKDMDRIAWAIENVMTPFVGDAPVPGEHGTSRINSLQLRADRVPATPKPAGVYRIFLTGGSTAFGAGAPSQETIIAAYLERMLNQSARPGRVYEVFTAANSAWASTHERIFIENRILDWAPDLVVSFSGNNDAHWGFAGENALWFFSYYDKHIRQFINAACSLIDRPPMPDSAPPGKGPVPPELTAGRLERNVVLSARALDLVKARYLFCLQPTYALSKKEMSPRELDLATPQGEIEEYFRRCYPAMRQKLAGLDPDNYAFADLTSVFDRLGPEEEIFIDHYHFGDKGNEIAARAVFKAIAPLVAE